jgi:hypothetical protein
MLVSIRRMRPSSPKQTQNNLAQVVQTWIGRHSFTPLDREMAWLIGGRPPCSGEGSWQIVVTLLPKSYEICLPTKREDYQFGSVESPDSASLQRLT